MLKTKTPLVSIVMPVYNAGPFLSSAIESIINQTYSNWELIIVDDASSDSSLSIAKKYARKDERVRVYKSSLRRGVSGAANLALSRASGKFIARMDADDVSLPERIEKEINFLLANPRFVAVGGQCAVINRTGAVIGRKNFPLKDRQVKRMIFTNIPVQQPTLMVNKNLLPGDFVWYDSGTNTAEEVEFLFRLFKFGKVGNLPDILLKYRIHGKNTSLVNPKRTFFMTVKTRILAMIKYHYRPTFTGILTTLGQTFVVLLLPNNLIYPLYSLIRGINLVSRKEMIELTPSFK